MFALARSLIILLVVVISARSPSFAGPSDWYWTGDQDNNWSTLNWDGGAWNSNWSANPDGSNDKGGGPASDAHIYFTASGADNFDPSNNSMVCGAGWWDSLYFNTSEDVQITGNLMSFHDSAPVSRSGGGEHTIETELELTFGGTTVWDISNSSGYLELAGRLKAPGTTVRKEGDGILRFTNSTNDYGNLTLKDGNFQVGGSDVCGNWQLTFRGGDIEAWNNARVISNFAAFEQDVAFKGNWDLLFNSDNSARLDNTVTLTVEEAVTCVEFERSITQAYAGLGLTKAGGGYMIFSGAANTYTGTTTVTGGTLYLGKSDDITAVRGNLVIGDGVGGAQADCVELWADQQIIDTANVTVYSSGLLDVGPCLQHIHDLDMTSGAVTTGLIGGLGMSGTLSAHAHATPATISGSLNLLPGSGMVQTDAGATLNVEAQVGGGVTITKYGEGILLLDADNSTSFFGDVLLYEGTLRLGDDGCVGFVAMSSLKLYGGKVEAVGAPRTISNALTLKNNVTFIGLHNMTFNNASGATLEGACTLCVQEAGLTVDMALAMNEAAAGCGLTKSGAGTMKFSGAGANGYTGDTCVNEGLLILAKPASVNAIGGHLTVGDGAGGVDADVVRLDADEQIPDASTVTINASGLLNLNGHDETIGQLKMTAGKVTTGVGTLTLGGDVTTFAHDLSATINGKLDLGGAGRVFAVADGVAAPDLDLSAAISGGGGGGGVTLNQPGTVAFSGTVANTYGGPTTVNDGTLILCKTAGIVSVPGQLCIVDAPGPALVHATTAGQLNGPATDVVISTCAAGGLTLDGGANQIIEALTMTGGTVAVHNASLTLGGLLTMNASGAVNSTVSLVNGNASLVLGGNVQATSDVGQVQIVSTAAPGTLSLGGATRTFTVNAGVGAIDTDMLVSADIIDGGGPSGVIKEGPELLALTSTGNTYSGGTTIKAGTLRVDQDGALGDAAGYLTFDGGTLEAAGDVTGARPLAITANGGFIQYDAYTVSFGGSGNTTWGGDLTVYAGGGAGVKFERTGGSVVVSPNVNLVIESGATVEMAGAVCVLSDGSNHVDVANDGLLNVNTPGQEVGTIDGIGDTVVAVNASLVADSIVQTTLTVGQGGRVVIRPLITAGGGDRQGNLPWAAGGNPHPVPEPDAFVLLTLGGLCLTAGIGRRLHSARRQQA